MREILVSELAAILSGSLRNIAGDTQVTLAPSASSTNIDRNGIFVAIRGNAADGHTFIGDAFARGARLVVVQDEACLEGHPAIVVADTRLALSSLADLAFDHPSRHMQVIGITGTNGKTTTNWIVYHLLHILGRRSLRIGTLGSEYFGAGAVEGSLTSPDPISLHRIMEQARSSGVDSCVMESSSHALDQARVEDVAFDVGVFTNLTRDHLDYHRTFERYFAAKSHLFDLLARSSKDTKVAVVNLDDQYGINLYEMCQKLGLRDFSFGRHAQARFRITDISEREDCLKIKVIIRDSKAELVLQAPFIGPHNGENVVAAFAAVAGLGFGYDQIAQALNQIPQVPGRLERVPGIGPRVFVDFAHTPDGLERVLKGVKPSTKGKLWCVFGCGGDRDPGKRPEMGRIAGAECDCVVVTSDNPRTEVPYAIIDQILISGIGPVLVEVDRAKAINYAITSAADVDTVVIAGKGHENYQIIGTTKYPFSDREEALRALDARS